MIEIHSHLLPGIDDGAADLATSISMVREYLQQGVISVFCTPHFSFRKMNSLVLIERFFDRYNLAMNDLQFEIARLQLPFKLHQGLEIQLSSDLLLMLQKYRQDFVINLAGTNNILIEMTSVQVENLDVLDNLIFGLELEGVKLILAHPEITFRNADSKTIKTLTNWIELERLQIQVNASSVVSIDRRIDLPFQSGHNQRKLTRLLLERGLVQYIASDAHDNMIRPPMQLQARQVLTKRYGEELADKLLSYNPAMMIANLL